MNPKNKQINDKVCPTCGTHLNPNATRCLVCGRTFTDVPVSTNPTNKIKSRGLPQFTLSLPVALGAILILIAIGAGVIYFVLRGSGQITGAQPTATPTATATGTPTTATGSARARRFPASLAVPAAQDPLPTQSRREPIAQACYNCALAGVQGDAHTAGTAGGFLRGRWLVLALRSDREPKN